MPDEVAALSGEARGLQGAGCAWGCLSPLAFLVPILVLTGIEERLFRNSVPEAVQSGVLLLCFLPVAVMVAKAGDALKRSNGLREDVKAAYARRFVRPVDAVTAIPGPDQTTFSTAGGEPATAIEVLPCSHRLWKVNDSLAPRWSEVAWSQVAEPSQFAAMAASWVEPLEPGLVDAAGQVTPTPEQQAKRELTPTEKEEIRKRVNRIWQPAFWGSLFFTVWLSIPLVLRFTLEHPGQFNSIGYLVITFALLSYYRLATSLPVARRLNRDMQNGELKIVRMPLAMLRGEVDPEEAALVARLMAGQAPAASAGPAHSDVVVEILPLSGLIWTEGGNPAEWRKVPLR